MTDPTPTPVDPAAVRADCERCERLRHDNAVLSGTLMMWRIGCERAQADLDLFRRTELKQRDLDAKVYAGMIAEMNHAREQRDAALARVAELESLVASLSERCHGQSEALAARAGKGGGE